MSRHTALMLPLKSLLIATLTIGAVGCENKTTATEKSSDTASLRSQSAAEIHAQYIVKPELTSEHKKRVPELLIVDQDATCMHYSTGYAEGFFRENIEKVFNQHSNPVGKSYATEDKRKDFIEKNPEAVERLRENLKHLPDDVRETAFNKVINEAISQNIDAAESRQAYAYCDQILDEHLSWITDRNGQAVTSQHILAPNFLTVIQYRSKNCPECDQQLRDIETYIADRHLFINAILVEREPNN